MARTVRDAALENRTARSRLKPQGQPYYRALEPGLLHLGYRKPLTGAGKWLARVYDGGAYRLHKVGVADDYSDPDGAVILSYRQAQAKARKVMVEQAGGGTGTVGDAMASYIAHLEADGRSPDSVMNTRHIVNAHILPTLGRIELVKLTPDHLKRWCGDLAKRPARVRTKAGAPQAYRRGHLSPASAKRIWISLRAARQYAYENDKAPSDRAWRKLRPFSGADVPRDRYLTVAEAKRLLNAASPEFRPLLQGALLTGARYGQLTALTVADFNPDAGTLRLRSRKGRSVKTKIYHAHLSDEGRAFFAAQCAGRAGGDLIFIRADGRSWERAHQLLRIRIASERAGIRPPVNFHMTRHTFASHAIMNGAPLLVVAKTLGHADTRMVERVYGHLAPSFVAEAIREAAPRFGISPGNVRPLHGRGEDCG